MICSCLSNTWGDRASWLVIYTSICTPMQLVDHELPLNIPATASWSSCCMWDFVRECCSSSRLAANDRWQGMHRYVRWGSSMLRNAGVEIGRAWSAAAETNAANGIESCETKFDVCLYVWTPCVSSAFEAIPTKLAKTPEDGVCGMDAACKAKFQFCFHNPL
jgi:hypothetical protein